MSPTKACSTETTASRSEKMDLRPLNTFWSILETKSAKSRPKNKIFFFQISNDDMLNREETIEEREEESVTLEHVLESSSHKICESSDGILNPEERLPDNDLSWKIGYQMLENREAGMLEIVDDLLGHPLFNSDSAHVFIPNDAYEERLRVLVPSNRLHSDESRLIEMNWADAIRSLVKFDCRYRKTKKATVGEFGDSDDFGEDDMVRAAENRDANRQRYHVHDKGSPFYCHPSIKSGTKIAIPQRKNKFIQKIKQNVDFYKVTVVTHLYFFEIGRFHLSSKGEPGTEQHDEYVVFLSLSLGGSKV
uniref:Uncharacterized protein n=1 Tax=Caenorhabditis japonica TaxID=281687 RepID=A0A8R1EKQ8_CAEJA